MSQINIKNKKELVAEMAELNFSVKEISKMLKISQSYVYHLKQQIYDDKNRKEIMISFKNSICNNELENFLNSISFKELCCLSRMFYTYGKSRKEKITHCLERFSIWNVLGLFPENISRESVKKAYFKSSKKTHPDLTKRDTNREFIELNAIYQDVLRNFENYKYYGY